MQPRERFARHGAGVFGDDELLALIIGTGSGQHRPIDIARGLLGEFGSLAGLAAAEIGELTPLPGLGLARAVQIQAALQAGRRSLLSQESRPSIQSADAAWLHLYPVLAGQPRESLAALYLSHSHRLLALRLLTTGNDIHTIVDPRQIFRTAIRSGAAGLIIAHNHPSGDPTASSADLAVTRRLAEAGMVVGVELLDHLIIGAGRYVSLAEQGVLVRPSEDWRAQPLRG
jgi:DNA repair protein RadC